ncbi:MAG: family 20 glycosylhydrolase [Planctomycetota bacterium]|nr:family 20 glycosylhydrolase [Planctomycetota bacterium]
MPHASDSAPLVGLHLDLKGVMFKDAYIPQLLEDLAGQGVNCVLVEYEDVFPFDAKRGVDVAYDPSVTWSKATLAKFLHEADRRGIEVIPLQQCLGHLEYIYRWRRYRKMALDVKYPSTVDVENPKANALILEMLEQVIEAHPNSKYVHLGMDEAHALVVHAKAKKRDVVEVFLNHLEKLCAVCESYGKKPMIWSDMLEDHLSPHSLKLFGAFKDRIVLCPWDYGSTGTRLGSGRVSGWRVSKEWLNEADNPDAPSIGAGNTFIEEMPLPVRRLVGKNLNGRWFTPMFQADMWSSLGFEVVGASAVRCSSNLAVLPFFNKLRENIRAWGRAVKRTRILGQIGTSWARGTTWCPPGYNIDLTWPLVGDMARSMGVLPKPFFPGVAPSTVDRIVKTLGRSRADWRLEGPIADEMEALAPKVTEHRHEWESLMLMARALKLQRQAEYNVLEVDFFHANVRPVESEWQRRIAEQKQTLKEIAALRSRIRAHFGKRYHGDAFEEWVHDLFDLHETRIKESQKICRKKLAIAKRIYAKK